MRDCCIWPFSSLTPLWLRSLPVPHPVTHKMQPTCGQPSRPMLHCALTAKVLMSNHQAFSHRLYWDHVVLWLLEFRLWLGRGGSGHWAKHGVVLCPRFSCMTTHADRESPLLLLLHGCWRTLSRSQSEESQVRGPSRISSGVTEFCFSSRLNEVRLERSEMTCCGRLFHTVGAAWENEWLVRCHQTAGSLHMLGKNWPFYSL